MDDETQTVNVKGVRSAAWSAAKARAEANDETLGSWVSRACEQLAQLEAGGPRLYPPGKPDSATVKPIDPRAWVKPGDPAGWERWAAAHRAAREAGMPRDFMASLRRQAAAELGVVQRLPPPRRRTDPPQITDERQETWQQNSRLTVED